MKSCYKICEKKRSVAYKLRWRGEYACNYTNAVSHRASYKCLLVWDLYYWNGTQINDSFFVFAPETDELFHNWIDYWIIEVQRNRTDYLTIGSPTTHHIWLERVVFCSYLHCWRKLSQNGFILRLSVHYLSIAIISLCYRYNNQNDNKFIKIIFISLQSEIFEHLVVLFV